MAREWIIKRIELPSNWFTLVLSLLDGTRLSQWNQRMFDRGGVDVNYYMKKQFRETPSRWNFKLLFINAQARRV